MDGPGQAGWDAIVAAPERALVALDYDGVLAPIVDDPDQAVPAPGAIETLRRLAGRVGTLAVVTGRPAEVVVRLGGLDSVPGLCVEGQYGAEHWVGGRLTTPDDPAGVVEAKPALPAALAEAGADPGVWVEDKRLALVVHTRRTRDPDGELDRLRPALERFAARYGLEPHPGKMVMELRPPGFDKGGVLSRLAEEHAPAAVLFAGDDVGDLPGFAAVERLREAGTPGLTVASASAEAVEVAQAADVAVDGPAGVVELLGRLADAVGGSGAGDADDGPDAGDADDGPDADDADRDPDAGNADRDPDGGDAHDGPDADDAHDGPDADDADDAVRSRRR